MKHIAKLSILFAVTILTACASNTGNPRSRAPLSIVVAVVDGSTTAISNSVAKRAEDAVASSLSQAGHSVLSADAVFSNTELRGHQLSRADLIDLARSATRPGSSRRTKVDVLAAIRVSTTMSDKGYASKLSTRISSQLINVNSGRILGSYNLTDPSGTITLNSNCNRRCRNERTGDQVAQISAAVGHELAASLSDYRPSYQASRRTATASSDLDRPRSDSTYITRTEYTVELRGMNPAAFKQYTHYMTDVFSGYKGHEITGVAGDTYELSYTSMLHPEKFERNLRRAAHELNWHVRVYVDGSNASIILEKQTLTKPHNRGNFDDW